MTRRRRGRCVAKGVHGIQFATQRRGGKLPFGELCLTWRLRSRSRISYEGKRYPLSCHLLQHRRSGNILSLPWHGPWWRAAPRVPAPRHSRGPAKAITLFVAFSAGHEGGGNSGRDKQLQAFFLPRPCLYVHLNSQTSWLRSSPAAVLAGIHRGSLAKRLQVSPSKGEAQIPRAATLLPVRHRRETIPQPPLLLLSEAGSTLR